MKQWTRAEIIETQRALEMLLCLFDDCKTSDLSKMTHKTPLNLNTLWNMTEKAIDLMEDILCAEDDRGTPLPHKYQGWTRPKTN